MCKQIESAAISIDDEYREKVLDQLRKCDDLHRDTSRVEDSPYTTVVHRDLWINNIMVLKGSRFHSVYWEDTYALLTNIFRF